MAIDDNFPTPDAHDRPLAECVVVQRDHERRLARVDTWTGSHDTARDINRSVDKDWKKKMESRVNELDKTLSGHRLSMARWVGALALAGSLAGGVLATWLSGLMRS
jgi:hypothetical protein